MVDRYQALQLFRKTCFWFLQILETSFGLAVRYDGVHSAEIELSKELYWNMTCGLCGTLDGNAENDFTYPDGDLVSGQSRFSFCLFIVDSLSY